MNAEFYGLEQNLKKNISSILNFTYLYHITKTFMSLVLCGLFQIVRSFRLV